MRRKDFIRLAGLEEGTFKVLLARKHIPLTRPSAATGWKDYSADDVLAYEAAAALARQGAKKSDAREWVETYGELAVERASLGTKSSEGAMFLGALPILTVREGDIVHDDFHPLIGTISEVAEEIERLQTALGTKHRVGGANLCNLNLCVEVIRQRATALGINDARLDQLVRWFQ
jgi:hypothetical protein